MPRPALGSALVDVETFPTLLVACGGEALFLGPVQPSATQVSRLIGSLQAQQRPAPGLPREAQGLFDRLAVRVLPDTAL